MAVYQYEMGTVDHRDENGRLQETVYYQKATKTWQDGDAVQVFGDKNGTKLYNHAKLNEFVHVLSTEQLGYFFRLVLNVNRNGEICRYDCSARRLVPLRSEREIQDYLGMSKSSWYRFRSILKERHIYQEIPHCTGKRYLLNPVYAVESHNLMTEEMAFAFRYDVYPYLSSRKRELVANLLGETSAPMEIVTDDEIEVVSPTESRPKSQALQNMERQLQLEKEIIDQFRNSVDWDMVHAQRTVRWMSDYMDDIIGA